MPFTQSFVQHSSRNLGVPVVSAGEHREDDAAEDHVVEVRDHEVRIAQLPVEGRG